MNSCLSFPLHIYILIQALWSSPFLEFLHPWSGSILFVHLRVLCFLVFTKLLFTHCNSTVYEIHNHFIQEKKKKKKRSHGTIHTFKNYFTNVFSVLVKISCIQIDLISKKNNFFGLLPCSKKKKRHGIKDDKGNI